MYELTEIGELTTYYLGQGLGPGLGPELIIKSGGIPLKIRDRDSK